MAELSDCLDRQKYGDNADAARPPRAHLFIKLLFVLVPVAGVEPATY